MPRFICQTKEIGASRNKIRLQIIARGGYLNNRKGGGTCSAESLSLWAAGIILGLRLSFFSQHNKVHDAVDDTKDQKDKKHIADTYILHNNSLDRLNECAGLFVAGSYLK